MSVGFVLGIVVLLAGYAVLYQMVQVWNHNPSPWRAALFTGCP